MSVALTEAAFPARQAGYHARTAGGAAQNMPGAAVEKGKAAEAGHFDALVQDNARAASARKNAVAAPVQDSRMAGRTVSDLPAPSASGAGGEENTGGGFIAFIKAVLDIINPLQHLPVISTIYRHVTGDEISPAARIVGGTLYGGPVGAAMGVANAVAVSNTGRDIGENVMLAFSGKAREAAEPAGAPPTQLAAADIIWNDPPPGKEHDLGTRGTMLAALDPQEIPSSDTPTRLRTRMNGTEPAQSLPYAPPVSSTKKGMLAPTKTAPAVSGAGLTTAPGDVGERNPATHPAEKPAVRTAAGSGSLKPEASPVLQLQDAPAAAARRAAPPEQIALASDAEKKGADEDDGESLNLVAPVADRTLVPRQMMEALEKYAALKRQQHSGLVSAQF